MFSAEQMEVLNIITCFKMQMVTGKEVEGYKTEDMSGRNQRCDIRKHSQRCMAMEVKPADRFNSIVRLAAVA